MNLDHFQKIIKNTYYDKDSQRGLDSAFRWFTEEVGELARDIRKGNKQAQENELGDVLAWLVSIANILDIDITTAAKRYENGCPKCKSVPCTCPN